MWISFSPCDSHIVSYSAPCSAGIHLIFVQLARQAPKTSSPFVQLKMNGLLKEKHNSVAADGRSRSFQVPMPELCTVALKAHVCLPHAPQNT